MVAAMLAVVLILGSVPVFAQNEPVAITGQVLGSDGEPKRGVLVDVMGGRRLFTQTGDNGEFSVTLRPGFYTIRVRDGNRRQEFPLDVEQVPGEALRPVFRVEWP